ncbi:MAG: hypothetical protein QM758_28715 [Armatimonas sp.]
MKPIVCMACAAEYSAKELPLKDARMLEVHCAYQLSISELRLLYRVQAYFQRCPDAQAIFKKRPISGSNPFPCLPQELEEDAENVRYLRSHTSSLERSFARVEEEIERRNRIMREVYCPACSRGRLAVRSEFWEAYQADDDINYYKLNTMLLQEDGVIFIQGSGWKGRKYHWVGGHFIGPKDPDYEFSLWLLPRSKKYWMLVTDTELAEIKEKWRRQIGL